MRLFQGSFAAAVVLVLFMTFTRQARSAAITLNFSSTGGSINDTDSEGTGFASRLPNTGSSLAANDANLNIDTSAGTLAISTGSSSNFNGQANMDVAEAFGISLSSLGLTTANEDFSVSATFINIPGMGGTDNQFGVYVGTASNNMIRGGLSTFDNNRLLFGVSNTPPNSQGAAGLDFNPPAPGATLTVTISRTAGVYKVLVGSADVTPAQPTFLNGLSTLQAGIFATHANSAFTVTADSFTASVVGVPEPASVGLLATAAAMLMMARRRCRVT